MKHRPHQKLIITETFRSVDRQQELYNQGRTTPGEIVTHRDGIKSKSNHQSGLAVDFAFQGLNGKLIWDDDQAWEYLGHRARANGLVWGGDWRSPTDKPHVEWPQTDKTTYDAAKQWLADAGLH